MPADKLLKFVTQKVIDEIKKQIHDLGQFACAKVDKVIAELKHAGAPIPNMKGWSCDQKIAFVAALGPYGVESLIAGALVGTLANNTVNTVKAYAKHAEGVAKSIADAAGVSASAKAGGGSAEAQVGGTKVKVSW